MSLNQYLNDVFLPNLVDFLTAPVNYPEMIWMTIPLVAIFIIMEFYFARYKDELGWGSATSNSLVLFFIFIDMIRHIYTKYGMDFAFQEHLIVTIPLVVFVGIMGLLLFIMNFFREMPKRVAFFISSPLTVNYIAYFAIFAVYTETIINTDILFAVFVFYLFLLVLFWIIKMAFPEAKIAENLPDFQKPLPKLTKTPHKIKKPLPRLK